MSIVMCNFDFTIGRLLSPGKSNLVKKVGSEFWGPLGSLGSKLAVGLITIGLARFFSQLDMLLAFSTVLNV